MRNDPYGQIPYILPFNADNVFEAILAPMVMRRLVWMEYFAFTLTWSAANNNQITANVAGAQAQSTIDPSIDFILKRITFNATVLAGSPVMTQPDLLLTLQERSGASNFTDVAHHINLWTGQYRTSDPINLPSVRYIRGNNTILGQITNNSNTAFLRADLGLEGVRVTYLDENRFNRNSAFGVVP